MLCITPYIVLIIGAALKSIYEDNIEKAQNQEYVTTLEIATPIVLLLLLKNLHKIIVFVIIVLYAVFKTL